MYSNELNRSLQEIESSILTPDPSMKLYVDAVDVLNGREVYKNIPKNKTIQRQVAFAALSRVVSSDVFVYDTVSPFDI